MGRGEIFRRSIEKFLHFLENYDDVISHFKSSEVFVPPSVREGFRIVALKVDACGLPVITVKHRINAACEFMRNNEMLSCRSMQHPLWNSGVWN